MGDACAPHLPLAASGWLQDRVGWLRVSASFATWSRPNEPHANDLSCCCTPAAPHCCNADPGLTEEEKEKIERGEKLPPRLHAHADG